MKQLLLALALVLVPSVSFAATDDVVRSNIVSKLLEVFVAQVNSIDYMLGQVAIAGNPAQFDTFKKLANNQLAATTQQIATLLNNDPSPTFGSVSPSSGGSQPQAEAKHPASAENITIEGTLDVEKAEIVIEARDVPEAYPLVISLTSPSGDVQGSEVKFCDQKYTDGIPRCRHEITYENVPVTSSSQPYDFYVDASYAGMTRHEVLNHHTSFSYKNLTF